MERHCASVAQIAASVRAFFDRGQPYRIFHGSTNSTRPIQDGNFVDISSLSHVLSVDSSRKVAVVEPNVAMDRLIEATLPHGLVPPVVMEFPGITVGGGYAGTAGESSSFRHGFFDDTVEKVEMVLADGDVVEASRTERPDLFYGAAGSVGTLGTVTLLEVKLMQAPRFVRTRYRRTYSVAQAVEAVQEEMARPENDYVDGILFSQEHGVIIVGELTNEKPADVDPTTFSHAWDPWFYMHVRERTQKVTQDPVDYIPLGEYLFRYDRGGFWVGEAAFKYFKYLPFTPFFRWLLDDCMHTRMMYRALHASGEGARFLIQDIAMPFESMVKFVEYSASEHGIWPLWLCPLKRRGPPTFHPFTTRPGQQELTNADLALDSSQRPDDEGMMLNVGVWGWGPKDPKAFVDKNRDLEAKVRSLGGMKWLYAHTYYSPTEFWALYGGRKWYDALRDKYKASTLPTVWDKVYVDHTEAAKGGRPSWIIRQWPIGGLYGIWVGIRKRDYLLARNALWKWNKA